jgi:hypothetical protein
MSKLRTVFVVTVKVLIAAAALALIGAGVVVAKTVIGPAWLAVVLAVVSLGALLAAINLRVNALEKSMGGCVRRVNECGLRIDLLESRLAGVSAEIEMVANDVASKGPRMDSGRV